MGVQRMEDDGIVHIERIDERESSFLVWEEHLSGELLSDVCARGLSSQQADAIFTQMLTIIHTLHHLDPPIIHRDLKPENFMLVHGVVILFDFDIAKPYDSACQKRSTIVGTLGYAAPEQLGFENSDPRCDIYSLGVILNELYCGHLPSFVLAPPPAEAIVRRCIELNPKDRYQNIDQLQEAFERRWGGIRCSRRQRIALSLLGSFLLLGSFSATVEGARAPWEEVLLRIALFLILFVPALLFCRRRQLAALLHLPQRLPSAFFRKHPGVVQLLLVVLLSGASAFVIAFATALINVVLTAVLP